VTRSREPGESRIAGGLALLLLCTANFLDAMDVSTIGVALPRIQADLGIGATTLQWAVSAYVLGYGGFLILGGKVADRFGHRRVFLLSLFLFGVASIAGALADGAATLVVARLVKGIAAAFTAPAALALLMSVVHEEKARARALGVFISTGGAGFILGMLVGGLVTTVSWRLTMVIGAPFAFLTLLLAPLALPKDHGTTVARRAFDYLGALTITLALLLLVGGVSNASAAGWADVWTWGTLALAAAMLVAFVAVEARHPEPMVPLAMFRNAQFTRALIVAFLFQGAYMGFQFVVTLYYQDVLQWSAFETGASLAICGVFVLTLAPRFAVLAQRVGPARVIAGGVALQGASYALWVLARGALDPLVVIGAVQLLFGLGYAMAFPAVQVAALADVREGSAGLASAMLFSSFQIGNGVILAVTAAIFGTARTLHADPYDASVLFSAILCGVVAVFTLLGRSPGTGRSTASTEAALQHG